MTSRVDLRTLERLLADCERYTESIALVPTSALSNAIAEIKAHRAELDSMPERFSHAVFVRAGLPLEMASVALMVSRRVLEEAELRRELPAPPASEKAP